MTKKQQFMTRSCLPLPPTKERSDRERNAKDRVEKDLVQSWQPHLLDFSATTHMFSTFLRYRRWEIFRHHCLLTLLFSAFNFLCFLHDACPKLFFYFLDYITILLLSVVPKIYLLSLAYSSLYPSLTLPLLLLLPPLLHFAALLSASFHDVDLQGSSLAWFHVQIPTPQKS